MKKKTVYLSFCFLLLSLSIWGQEQGNYVSVSSASANSETKLDTTITLNYVSKQEDILVKIEKQTKSLELMISSSVNAGNLTIKVYDPNGNEEGNFSVGSQLDSEKSKSSNGTICKSLNEPQAGNWRVKIIPIKAKGIIRIQTKITLK